MDIIRKTTPHFRTGRAGMKPEAIVIHIMAGTLKGTDAWFASDQSKVSAHYGVGKNGEVHQYVDESNTAFHAGTVERASWPLLKRGAGRAPVNPNLYTIGIEHEGTENSPWTDAMYQSSAELIAGIAARWNIPLDRNHVIKHHEIRASKPCPGSQVDMDRLITLAKAVKV